MLGIATAHKQVPPRNVGLTQWLAGHHLTSGLAPYWEASSVTVDSGGAITVLAIQPEPYTNRLEPQHWQTDVLLATQKGRTANFVVISPAENLHRQYVLRTFGRPAWTYYYRPFTDHGLAQEPAALPRYRAGRAPRARRHHRPRRHHRVGPAWSTAIAGHWPRG